MRSFRPFLIAALALTAFSAPTHAESVTMKRVTVPEWKSVYGRIEARDRIPARARLGGTVMTLAVTEGDMVTAGQTLATIVDAKLDFQLSALKAQREAAASQLANAEAELKRGEELLKQGVTTAQRLDAQRTQVDVIKGQIAALDAQAEVISQQQKEGAVLAPLAGRVLDVPVAEGAVLMPGEVVAQIGGGGIFLRLAVPERHAADLHAGDSIQIGGAGAEATGKLVRIYPLVENGRVVADVEVQGLPDTFVDARVLVRLPVGERQALMVPQSALVTRNGLDFVAVGQSGATAMRAVVPGQPQDIDGTAMVEILSGLNEGDVVQTTAPAAKAAENE